MPMIVIGFHKMESGFIGSCIKFVIIEESQKDDTYM